MNLAERRVKSESPRVGPQTVGVIAQAFRVLGVHHRVLLRDGGRHAEVTHDGLVEHRARFQRSHVLGGLLQRVTHACGVHHDVGLAGLRRIRWRLDIRREGDGCASTNDDRLHLGGQCRQDLMRPRHQPVERGHREHVGGLRHHTRGGVHPQVHAGDHAKEAWTGAARGPEKVGVLAFAGVHQIAVGGYHIDGHQVLAPPAPGAAVPALPALQHKATETNR